MYKCNISDSKNCKCGEKETVKHYLLECTEYDTAREFMKKNVTFAPEPRLLLDVKLNDDFTDWRSFILSELENFVAETRRSLPGVHSKP